MNLAVLTLVGLQAATPAAPCGCAQFAGNTQYAAHDGTALSAGARTIRDFTLHAHRRIAEDLIQRHGPYLETLVAYFPHCADREVKLAWLRQLLASTSDTRVFAERIANQYEASRVCGRPDR
jgi:3-oxoacyl-[acyl-carrier-protein] synthase III